MRQFGFPSMVLAGLALAVAPATAAPSPRQSVFDLFDVAPHRRSVKARPRRRRATRKPRHRNLAHVSRRTRRRLRRQRAGRR